MPEAPSSPPNGYRDDDRVLEIIATSWCAILGVPAVVADDDFFELGGDSILATRIASSLRRELAVEVDILLIWEVSRFGDFQAAVAAIAGKSEIPQGA